MPSALGLSWLRVAGDVQLAGVSGFDSGAVSAGALRRDPASWADPDTGAVDHPVGEQGVRRGGEGCQKVNSFNVIFVTLCARNWFEQKGIEPVIALIGSCVSIIIAAI